MVFSYYLLKIPFTLTYKLLSFFKLNNYNAAYCDNMLDYEIMKPVLKRLPGFRIIARNKRVKAEFAALGIKADSWPAFPRNVIMCRLSAHKFPARQMKKIGLRHGPFHFKKLPAKENFLLFDKFIFTSKKESEIAEAKGITNGLGLGYPKLDKAFDGSIDKQTLKQITLDLKLDKEKPILLFTATWQKSGMSALEHWLPRLGELSEKFNILVTLHPWISDSIKDHVCNLKNVYLIEKYDVIPYILLADYCIGDTSSILAECCALDKKIITFKTSNAPRSVDMACKLIEDFSIQIETLDELQQTIDQYRRDPKFKKEEREKANHIMFSNLDGSSGKKIADFVKNYFSDD